MKLRTHILYLFIIAITIPLSIFTYINTTTVATLSALPDSISVSRAQRQLALSFVVMDLQELGLSAWQTEKFVRLIDSASILYNVPPLLIHSVARIESDYNIDARHPTIYYKGRPTYAVGTMGVVWEYWADSLRAHGIVENRRELADPEKNIAAGTYILSKCIERAVNKQVSRSQLFGEIVRYYYGDYNAMYQQKLKTIASELWMKVMAKEIILAYKSREKKP